jgi:hypothetical protein
MAGATVTVEEVRKAQRATGPATVLAIGTATPANCVHQADYPDYYFRITKSEHMTELKEKFKRMCEYLFNCLSHLALFSPSVVVVVSIVRSLYTSTRKKLVDDSHRRLLLFLVSFTSA